jgi:hypothetical protein
MLLAKVSFPVEFASMNTTRKLLASVAVMVPAALAIAPSVAHATPYAFASNDITGLTITGIPLADITSATTNVNDSAIFAGSAGSTNQGNGIVGAALTIPQAYSGPGTAPPAVFTAVGPGNFIGTRADADIGAGNAGSGGVSVRNVAEGYGAAQGNSVGNNSSTITFHVVGTGSAVTLSFNDAYMLIASTAAAPNETASASITNTFSVTNSSGVQVSTYAPGAINAHIGSGAGVPPTNTYSGSGPFTFTTPTLAAGETYNISLASASLENILPGTTRPVPEPASIAILGAGLLGLGLTFRRKRS